MTDEALDMTTNPEGLRELTEVELRLDREQVEYINEVAAQSGTTPDQAASVIAVMAVRMFLAAQPKEDTALAAPINPVAVDSTVIGGAAAAGREGPTRESLLGVIADIRRAIQYAMRHGFRYESVGYDPLHMVASIALDAARASTPEANDEPR